MAKALSSEQRTQWNDFIDHAGKSEGGGDPTKLPALMESYKSGNPQTTLTPEHIPVAAQEVADIKGGKPIGGLTLAQASYVKSGMSDGYKNDSTNLKYPVSSVHGTNLEDHAKAGDPKIPLPNYDDPASRQTYAKHFSTKYGPLMQGRGDTPLRINETPDSGSASAKELAIKAAKPLGIDPTLLYTSAMEEGMSGLFGDKKGQVDFSGDEKHPISGYVNFGLDNFSDQFPKLVKKGYLPKEFASEFTKSVEPARAGDNKVPVNSANFTTTDAALQAKAATMKDLQDQVDAFAKKKNINLTPKQREFFTLTAFNGGGNMQKMMTEYNQKGALKDDSFIANPETGGYKTIHKNVGRRILMRDALKNEGLNF